MNKQTNFWCHIINSFHYHHNFDASEGITGPVPDIKLWARWDNEIENSANTYMFTKIVTSSTLTNLINNSFNNDLFKGVWNAIPSPSQSLLMALKPDVKITSGQVYRNQFQYPFASEYSVDITKTCLHELSHAGMYTKVGDVYWVKVGVQEYDNEGGGNYGFGNIYTGGVWHGNNPQAFQFRDNYIELTEAWAEFLGENYTRRIYTFNTAAVRMHSPLGGGANGIANNYNNTPGGTPYQFFTLESKQEDGKSWSDRWIPCGMFNDLMDISNTSINENDWDKYGGYTIQEMYNAFDNTRPAHIEYLKFLAPMHNYSYTDLAVLYNENLN
jgi:hypothetical protein